MNSPIIHIIMSKHTNLNNTIKIYHSRSKPQIQVSKQINVQFMNLKDQENMPHVIVTDHDIALRNWVVNVSSTSFTLLCRYNITKNMRSKLKYMVGTKQIKGEDAEMIKSSVVLENIIDA